MGKVKGKWVAAHQREIELLDTYYSTLEPGTLRRRYLRRWLFGVVSGLRLSDQRAARRDWLVESTLVFRMCKGQHQEKQLTLPVGGGRESCGPTRCARAMATTAGCSSG